MEGPGNLEGDTQAEAQVVYVVDVVVENRAFVGSIAVVYGQVKTDAVGPGVDIHADFGREVEAPGIVLYFVDVEFTRQLGIVGTEFQTDIRLAVVVAEPVVGQHPEGYLEEGVLLVGGQSRCSGQGDGLTGDVLVVGVILQEAADGQVEQYVVTTFKVHAPAAGPVGKRIAGDTVELPVDIEIGVRGKLSLARKGEDQGDDS